MNPTCLYILQLNVKFCVPRFLYTGRAKADYMEWFNDHRKTSSKFSEMRFLAIKKVLKAKTFSQIFLLERSFWNR